MAMLNFKKYRLIVTFAAIASVAVTIFIALPSATSEPGPISILGDWASEGKTCNSGSLFIKFEKNNVIAYAKGKFLANVAEIKQVVSDEKNVVLTLGGDERWNFKVVNKNRLKLVYRTENGEIVRSSEKQNNLLNLTRC